MNPHTISAIACRAAARAFGGALGLVGLLLCAGTAAGAPAPSSATPAAAAPPATATPAPPAPAVAPGTLDSTLADLAGALRTVASERPSYMIASADPASLLDGYAAQTLAARLDRPGSPARRLNSNSSPPSEKPFADALADCLLQSLRQQKATVFVQIGGSLEGQQRLLTAAAYDVSNGRLLSRTRTVFQLPTELEALVAGERASLTQRDKDWLQLFDQLFPAPTPAPGGPDAAVRLAQAEFFLESGLWPLAARSFADLSGGQPNRLFARAVVAQMLAGDADAAQALLQSALNTRPDSGPLWALQAWVGLRGGRPSDAIMWLAQTRHDEVRKGLYTYARGLIALEQNDAPTAEQALTSAADLLPDQLFAQYQAARFYWQRADLQSALRYYRRATQTSAATAETWSELAMALDADDDTDGALSSLRQAFRMRSDNPVITRQLAGLLKRQGQFEESLQVLRRAKDANPCSAPLQAAYGDGAAEMWHVPEAEAAFREAVSVGGDFPYGVARLAEMLRIQRHYQEAQSLLMGLLASHPDYQPARLELGRVLAEMDQSDEALSTLNEAARSPQYEVDAKLATAEVYISLKQPDEAVRNAQIAVSLRPDARTYAALSEAFLSTGDADKALSTAKSALDKGPDSADAHLAMARVLDATGQTTDALREAEAALKVDPYSVDALSLEGTLRRNQNDSRECAALWQRALALNPWNADLHYRLAELLGKTLGDSAGALEHYNQYFQLEKLRTGASR